MKENSIQIVILAAGLGKRMGIFDRPKVLTPLNGKPMLAYLLESIEKSDVNGKPVIVVGKHADQVQDAFGPEYTYVFQTEQLGTGHAVKVAKEALAGVQHVMVLYGDHPLVSPALIKNIADAHLKGDSALTMATATVPDFEDWRGEFKWFSRIIRDAAGNIVKDVQIQDATPEQLAVKELNPCYYCFRADWLWQNLENINTNNAQKEYYLTDLVKMAIDQGEKITTVPITDIKEALGINTQHQFSVIEKLF